MTSPTPTHAAPATFFPVDTVRARFPALQGPDAPIRLDNPAGTPVPSSVIEATVEAYRTAFANGGGAFDVSVRFDATLARARERAALLMGTDDPGEIALGPSMTTLTMHVSRAVTRTLGPGDAVVVTRMDHEANVSPWLIAARDRGAEPRWLPFDRETWRIEPDALREVLADGRVRLLALNHASNMTGSVNDVAALCAIARELGVLTYVDGVQATPHLLPDVRTLGCDLYVSSAYKYFGPHMAALWGRREVLERLQADRLRCGPTDAGEKWEWGTPQVELAAGYATAVDYLEALGREIAPGTTGRDALRAAFAAAKAHEDALATLLIEGLLALPGVTIHGITDPARVHERVPTVSFTHARHASRDIAAALAEGGICAWAGYNYALAVAEHLGLDLDDGVVRLGLAHFNRADEVETALERLGAILSSS